MTNKKTRPFARLPQDLHKQIADYAKKNGYSMNTVVIMALRKFFDVIANQQAS